jgi:hypothetical protein
METVALGALIDPGCETRSLIFNDPQTIKARPKAHKSADSVLGVGIGARRCSLLPTTQKIPTAALPKPGLPLKKSKSMRSHAAEISQTRTCVDILCSRSTMDTHTWK